MLPAAHVLEGLRRVLQLNTEQTAHAEDQVNRAQLLRTGPGSRGRERSTTAAAHPAHGAARPGHGPAHVQPCLERAGDGATHQFVQSPGSPAHYVSIVFTDSRMRKLDEGWSSVARMCVGILRRKATQNLNEPELAELAGRLSSVDDNFRRWWSEYQIDEQDSGIKTVIPSVASRLQLN